MTPEARAAKIIIDLERAGIIKVRQMSTPIQGVEIFAAEIKAAEEQTNLDHHCAKCQEAHSKPPYQCPNCIGIGKAEGRKEDQARLKELLDEKARLCYEEAAQIAECFKIGKHQLTTGAIVKLIAEAIRARIGEK